MIPRGPAIATGALTLSLAIHGGGFAFWSGPEPIEVAGGGGGETALLGDGFADLVSGTVTGTPPEPTAPAPDAPVLQPAEAEAEPPAPIAPSEQPGPTMAEQPMAEEAPQAATAAEGAEPVVARRPEAAEAPQAAAATGPLATPATAPVRPAAAAAAPVAPVSTAPPEPERIAAMAPPEVRTPDAATPRPEIRPAPEERIAEPPPEPAPDPSPQPAPPSVAGNAERDAARGEATGAASGQSAATGQPSRPAVPAGNAAASNYPGQVMRAIQRARRRTNEAGIAVVSFSIAGNGALASLGIARSSGNPALDQVALDTLRRAAPFPAPPAGAQSSFSIEIAGR